MLAQLKRWFGEEGYWYATGAVVHAIAFVILALVVSFLPGLVSSGDSPGNVPALEPADTDDSEPPDLSNFKLGAPQENFADGIDVNAIEEEPSTGGSPVYVDESLDSVAPGGGMMSSAAGPELGGLGGFTVQGIPGVGGPGGVGVGIGTGDLPGSGDGQFPGIRRPRRREDRATGTRRPAIAPSWAGWSGSPSTRAPAAIWSLQHSRFCPSKPGCGGEGSYHSDVAATALALLPFLAAGQTPQTRSSPFAKQIGKGLTWLISQQAANGSIARHGSGGKEFGEDKPMYTHALATIVLCEAYAMTHDPKYGAAAAKAVRFIEEAQNESTGGWRYFPRIDGDTSVLGWQVMALKSAQMAGLGVNSVTLENPRKWLASVATGRNQGLFRYQPYRAEDRSMTAVGQLCLQYMGSAPDDPQLLEGKHYLMGNLPDTGNRDIYYWYYATLVLHNYLDADWDKWMRAMRRVLVNTQASDGCGTGSWDPELPTMDAWGNAGGRLYMTSLSVLTLEVYYRYLPLFGGNRSLLDSPPAKAAPAAKGVPAAKETPAAKEAPAVKEVPAAKDGKEASDWRPSSRP